LELNGAGEILGKKIDAPGTLFKWSYEGCLKTDESSVLW
jgi:hypothetical protein